MDDLLTKTWASQKDIKNLVVQVRGLHEQLGKVDEALATMMEGLSVADQFVPTDQAGLRFSMPSYRVRYLCQRKYVEGKKKGKLWLVSVRSMAEYCESKGIVI